MEHLEDDDDNNNDSDDVEDISIHAEAKQSCCFMFGQPLLNGCTETCVVQAAAMAYDEVLGHVILFGGQNNNMLLNDSWELTP